MKITIDTDDYYHYSRECHHCGYLGLYLHCKHENWTVVCVRCKRALSQWVDEDCNCEFMVSIDFLEKKYKNNKLPQKPINYKKMFEAARNIQKMEEVWQGSVDNRKDIVRPEVNKLLDGIWRKSPWNLWHHHDLDKPIEERRLNPIGHDTILWAINEAYKNIDTCNDSKPCG